MKKLLSSVLCAILLSVLCTGAFADTAAYSSTQSVLDCLDEMGIRYTNFGVDEDGDEAVVVPNSDSKANQDYDIVLFFDSDNEHCAIRVWNIITFDQADFVKILEVCNTLNNTYRYVTFYADTSDNTITMSMDLIFRSSGTDEIVTEALIRMSNIFTDAYSYLAPYSR